jgi:hypothetical protein
MIVEYRRHETIGMQGKQPREPDRWQRMISVWVPSQNACD